MILSLFWSCAVAQVAFLFSPAYLLFIYPYKSSKRPDTFTVPQPTLPQAFARQRVWAQRSWHSCGILWQQDLQASEIMWLMWSRYADETDDCTQ